MTVEELRGLLDLFPDDTKVAVAVDESGDEIIFPSDLSGGFYDKGKVVTDEDASSGAKRVVVLWS